MLPPENDPSFSVNSWTPRDVILRDAWFPVANAHHVGRKPVRRSIHSQPYYLWRDGNGVAVASEFHPANPVKDGGFFTGGTGFYPAIERWGYIWAWYGDPANADEMVLPDVPYLPRDGGLPKYMSGTVRFDCTSALSLENLIDLTHADYLHASVVGDDLSDDDGIEVVTTSETVTMIRTCKGKSVAPVMRYVGGTFARTQDVRAVIHIFLRSHVALAYGRYRPGFDVPLFHPCIPETRDRCRLDYTFNMSGTLSPFRYVMPKASYIVSGQDNYMTRPQNQAYLEPTRRRDLHSPFDQSGQKYRAGMQALARRQAAGDYSYRSDGLLSADCSELLGIDRKQYQR
ncbi:oxygenase [Sphingobium sp. TCM1]|nr:oxygenase [Sphingobium sp. TCM1]